MRDLPQIGDIVYLKANPAVKMTVEKCTYTRNAAMVTCSVPDPITGLMESQEFNSVLLEKETPEGPASAMREPTMFRQIFSFDGRIRRLEFGCIFVIYWIFYGVVIGFVDAQPLLGFAFIPMLWLIIAASCKRCHDTGRSGWWQLVPLFFFWLLFEDGQRGPNEYGPNPKGI